MARLAALVAVWVMAGSSPALAQNGGRLLDVPYLTQTPELCGGAAVAMVLRYWGAATTQPVEFASLVDHGAAGIPTDVLTGAVRTRGWQAVTVGLDAPSGLPWIREHIQRGRPVVTLIAVGPSRYHYVVIVAASSRDIVVHDPARGPFEVLTPAAFERAWAAAGRWALLILPADAPLSIAGETPPALANATAVDHAACYADVASWVEVARAGDLGRAEAGLAAALHACPERADAWRELAAVRFLQSRWADAAALAAQAAVLDPADVDGRELLATSRYMNDERADALAQWNTLGQPLVDQVHVEGARRTRHPDIVAMVDLPPLTLLTPARLARASRRLDALPSAASTRLRYQPLAGGRARVDAIVAEDALVPRGLASWIAIAARTWLQREARLDAVAPTGSGERWTVAWRWWEARPRVLVALALPSPRWVPGITTVSASWERPTYLTSTPATPGAVVPTRRAHRRVSLGVADWATSWLRWNTGLAVERWTETRYVSADAALDARLADDRVAIRLATTLALPWQAPSRFAVTAIDVDLRTSTDGHRPRGFVEAGVETASATAPFDRWPGAGAGQARAPWLRAHPLLEAGVVTGATLGRQLAHATAEYQQPVWSLAAGTLHAAAFMDIARAWHPLVVRDAPPRALVDAGIGVRLVLPGRGGTLRVDLARGLRDHATAVSAGWQAPWPGR